MSRTAEKILSIFSVVLTTIGVMISFASLALVTYLKSDPLIQKEFEVEMLLIDPTLTPEHIDMFYGAFDIIGGVIWFIIISLIVSLILTIIGMVNIWKNKNPKLAGIMFIIAGLTAGILTLSSILLYIAAILCFTKKASLTHETQFVDDKYDGTMRPL
ncbi:DUF4064 domain-containing protein [Sporosarcina sp. ANT_H38]|uniref:DUF4064 domain-containing protein n=1 Tax=Sporosarcina sp. ANT_H38 TaxID=2597358 RepID=UPI0011F3ED65|nr:DUF4064 domain-containing protein [Sporosarcina sp. ANT_H38]KAA0948441.1 DUF4064 domain-containing protein [Sporosarcina sp. ANT_H38]